MNWQKFWDKQAQSSQDLHSQVGRVKGGQSLGPDVLAQVLLHIRKNLDLKTHEGLLDVCCGNGVLTRELAQYCHHVVGVDLSAAQLHIARQNSAAESISYVQGNATELTTAVQEQFEKISLYFSFQYLETYTQGKDAIQGMLLCLKPGGRIFIGDVPDVRYLGRFYPRLKDRLRFYYQNLSGKNDMGKFWSEKEIGRICTELGATYQRLEQPAHLPYAHYRCDYLIFPAQ